MRGGQAHRPLGTVPTGMPPLSSAAGSPVHHLLPGVLSCLRLGYDAWSSTTTTNMGRAVCQFSIHSPQPTSSFSFSLIHSKTSSSNLNSIFSHNQPSPRPRN